MSDIKETTNETNNQGRIRQENKKRIMSAAETVFAKNGFRGSTTASIAEVAGLPKANIHYYFGTKEELYRAVVDDIVELWLSSFREITEEDDPASTLADYIRAKMELSRRRPFGSRVWASEILGGAKFTSDYISVEVKTWLENCETVIAGWIEDGRLTPIDPKALMYMIWATTQHYADFGAQIEILNGGKPLSDEQFLRAKETVTTVILRGVGAL